MNLTDCLSELVKFQEKILDAFAKEFPNLSDHIFLTDYPTRGQLAVDTELWKFQRHGKGVCFRRERPLPAFVVDIHTAIRDPSVVDEWRLLEFLESKGEPVGKSEIQSSLSLLENHGCLENLGASRFRFRPHRAASDGLGSRDFDDTK
jgi:hypothetical protein